ncbi:MAG TPA: hypothetical protein VKY24_13035 [Reyranella sp.]|jgi:hypothetical protein|nr:hypothetical protein [Reyranella sp.]
MRQAVMRWRSSWRREDVLFALLLLLIAAAIIGLAGIAIDAIGRV